MEFTLTSDHDEIRSWVEEHGGKPAIREKHERRRGVIDICFEELNPDLEIISWEEFFDTFDALEMVFRYECLNTDCTEFSYSILSKSEEPDGPDGDLDTEMPEDVPIENVIPSAPSMPSPDSPNKHATYT